MADRREMRDLADPERAREVVAALDVDPGTERVPLGDARDRVLAERVDATIDVPGFDRSAMDGYAVRAADTAGAREDDPVELAVAGDVAAGERPGATVSAGEAVEVATGAVLPEGADAVVMVEETDPVGAAGGSGESAPSGGDGSVPTGGDGSVASGRDDSAPAGGDRIAVRSAVTPGENVATAGSDLAAGDRVLGPGTVLSPRTLALLAAVGRERVPVVGRPRVAVLSTGEELVPPGESLDHGAGQVHDVNETAIAAAVADAGGEVVRREHVGDDREALVAALEAAADAADLVLTSGSTSAGRADRLYGVLEDLGELRLHGVAVKPGKPTLVGTVAGTPYVGLPGYPVSAQSVFRAFVAPAIRAAAGRPSADAATTRGEMAVTERYDEGRHRLVPVGIVGDGSGRTLVYPVDRGSGATTSLGLADGIVRMPADVRAIEAGEAVTVEGFGADPRPPSVLAMGERDPTLDAALDRLDRPRFVATGDREGRRRLAAGVPDVAVVTGDPPAGESVGAWDREWGLATDAEAVLEGGLAALVDGDVAFANRSATTGLREAFDAALADLADERGERAATLRDAIDGYGLETAGLESPVRRVRSGEADAGLALASTAAALDVGFVPLGTQSVRAVAAADRTGKPGVDALSSALDAVSGDVLAG